MISTALTRPRIWRTTLPRGVPAWAVAVAVAVAGLVVAPLVSLVLTALSADLSGWARLAADVLPVALMETASLLLGVAVVTGVVGIGTAWLVTAHCFPGRRVLAWLLPLPLAVPAYITAYIYVEIFDAAGPVQMALRGWLGFRSRGEYWFPEIRSLGGCILVMSAVLYPYVYLSARAMFLTQSACMMEVARTLGAGRFELFRTVALPLARPALAVGLSLALLEALNDIGASEYLGVRTLTVSIYTTWLNRGSLGGAAQIACVMLVVVLGLIWLERHGRADRRYGLSTRRPRVAQPTPLTPGGGLLAALACAIPVALGFGLPFGFLVREIMSRGLVAQIDAAFLRHLGTTVGLAFAATLAALALAVVVVTAARFARHRLTEATRAIAGVGYAVPGTVLALGLLGPLVTFDEGLNAVWRWATGGRLGLVVMGSAAGLVIAYVIRFLPIATGSLGAGLDRVSAGIEDAARTLGARPRELVMRVQLPLLRPALASAGLLVFVDTLKELPATLLLRPLNVETLATLVYGHASRGAFEDGALAAMVIVLVGLWPVMRLTRGAEARMRAAPAG
ncbi:ABC transporter permease [Salinarimonas soli]|nr:iron ABC transporter permease [Salinarimonas soli]